MISAMFSAAAGCTTAVGAGVLSATGAGVAAASRREFASSVELSTRSTEVPGDSSPTGLAEAVGAGIDGAAVIVVAARSAVLAAGAAAGVRELCARPVEADSESPTLLVRAFAALRGPERGDVDAARGPEFVALAPVDWLVLAELSEASLSAHATAVPWTAAPIPSATANPPTRPTNLDPFIQLPYDDDHIACVTDVTA